MHESARSIRRAMGRTLEISGQNEPLVDLLSEPLCRALRDRQRFYVVSVESVGRIGEVLVTITGARGRLPLLFRPDDLEPGDVFRIVSDTVDKFAI